MSFSVNSATFGSEVKSFGQQIVASIKWCGREISQGFKSHIIPATKTVWTRAIAFLSTGIGAGVAAMILGFCIVTLAASQKDTKAQIALSILGIVIIAAGIASITVVGTAALI